MPTRAGSSPPTRTDRHRPMSPIRAMRFIAIVAFLLLVWLAPDWLRAQVLLIAMILWLAHR